jgi:hypothetical protein
MILSSVMAYIGRTEPFFAALEYRRPILTPMLNARRTVRSPSPIVKGKQYVAKSRRKSVKRWTAHDIRAIRKMVKEKTPGRTIAKKLGRTLGALYMKVSQEGIRLRPTRTSVLRKRSK